LCRPAYTRRYEATLPLICTEFLMPQSQSPNAANESVISTSSVELVVASLLLIFGIVVAYGSYQLGSGWTSDGPGAGYFPFYVGILICIAGIGVFAQTVLAKDKGEEAFVDREQLQRVMSVFVPALLYVGAVQMFGLYVASAVYIALFMVILGKYKWLKSVVISLSVIVLFFLMFEVWFKVPLFKGSINLLSYLGY
jgi:Tripartite tricarboxylate transporter TctB family